MSEDSEWDIDDQGQPIRKRKGLKVEISRDAEVDSLQAELADANRRAEEGDKERVEAEVGMAVLELFEREKTLQKQLHPNQRSQIENCHTPEQLENLVAGYTPPAPVGKSSSGEGSVYELQKMMQDSENMTQTELLDSIYQKLNNPSKYSKEDVEMAQRQRRQLWENLVKGGQLAEFRRQKHTVYKNKMVTYCSNCEKHGVLTTLDLAEGDTCPKCGAKYYERGR
jgi:hypothetical protein